MVVKELAPGLDSGIHSNFKKIIFYIWKQSSDKWEPVNPQKDLSKSCIFKKKKCVSTLKTKIYTLHKSVFYTFNRNN